MSLGPPSDMPDTISAGEQSAAALDQAIDTLKAGHPINRAQLLKRHPDLADALDMLQQLAGDAANPSAHSMRQPLPEWLGPYRIDRELGAGGFGSVYLAYDRDIKRPVALKVLHPDRLGQPEVVERFQREACAIARLRHAGIVQLYDYSRQGPPYYLVTEYVEGVHLGIWSKRQGSGHSERADLVARIAETIDHAHAQGVYHRDLKPANILIDKEEIPTSSTLGWHACIGKSKTPTPFRRPMAGSSVPLLTWRPSRRRAIAIKRRPAAMFTASASSFMSC
jgi:serine/threonine protein kinase